MDFDHESSRLLTSDSWKRGRNIQSDAYVYFSVRVHKQLLPKDHHWIYDKFKKITSRFSNFCYLQSNNKKFNIYELNNIFHLYRCALKELDFIASKSYNLLLLIFMDSYKIIEHLESYNKFYYYKNKILELIELFIRKSIEAILEINPHHLLQLSHRMYITNNNIKYILKNRKLMKIVDNDLKLIWYDDYIVNLIGHELLNYKKRYFREIIKKKYVLSEELEKYIFSFISFDIVNKVNLFTYFSFLERQLQFCHESETYEKRDIETITTTEHIYKNKEKNMLLNTTTKNIQASNGFFAIEIEDNSSSLLLYP